MLSLFFSAATHFKNDVTITKHFNWSSNFNYIISLPLTDHEGPQGECSYNSTLSLISALDGGGWSTPRRGRFTPGKDPVPIV